MNRIENSRESQTRNSELCNVFPKLHSERMLVELLCKALVVKGNFDLRGHLAIPEPSVNVMTGSEALDIQERSGNGIK